MLKFLLVFIYLLSSHLLYADPGELDSSFGNNGTIETQFGSSAASASQMLILDDGRILTCGNYYDGNYKIILAMYDSLGDLDTDFGTSGTEIISISGQIIGCYGLSLGSEDDFYLLGSYNPGFTITDFFISHFDLAGNIDSDFGSSGYAVSSLSGSSNGIAGISYNDEGNLSIAAENNNVAMATQYSSTGIIDSDFGSSGIASSGLTATVRTGAFQSDGKILVAGDFTVDSQSGCGIFRFNTDGSIDTDYGTNGLAFVVNTSGSGCYSMTLTEDDEAIISAIATNGSYNIHFLAKFDSDGNLDSSFGSSGSTTEDFGRNSEIYAVASQEDGKIIVGASENNSFALSRYDVDGSLDTSFGTDGTFYFSTSSGSNTARKILVQSDGKILLAGANSDSEFVLARINGNTADLGLEISSDSTATTEDDFTYSIVASNSGPDSAGAVTVTLTLPEGSSVSDNNQSLFNPSLSSDQGSCSQADQIIRCELGTLENGDSVTILLTVNFASAGSYSISGQISAQVVDETNNSSSAKTVEISNPTGTSSPAGLLSGGTLGCQINSSKHINTIPISFCMFLICLGTTYYLRKKILFKIKCDEINH